MYLQIIYKFPRVFNCASFIARSRSDLSKFPWIIPCEPLWKKKIDDLQTIIHPIIMDIIIVQNYTSFPRILTITQHNFRSIFSPRFIHVSVDYPVWTPLDTNPRASSVYRWKSLGLRALEGFDTCLWPDPSLRDPCNCPWKKKNLRSNDLAFPDRLGSSPAVLAHPAD